MGYDWEYRSGGGLVTALIVSLFYAEFEELRIGYHKREKGTLTPNTDSECLESVFPSRRVNEPCKEIQAN